MLIKQLKLLILIFTISHYNTTFINSINNKKLIRLFDQIFNDGRYSNIAIFFDYADDYEDAATAILKKGNEHYKIWQIIDVESNEFDVSIQNSKNLLVISLLSKLSHLDYICSYLRLETKHLVVLGHLPAPKSFENLIAPAQKDFNLIFLEIGWNFNGIPVNLFNPFQDNVIQLTIDDSLEGNILDYLFADRSKNMNGIVKYIAVEEIHSSRTVKLIDRKNKSAVTFGGRDGGLITLLGDLFNITPIIAHEGVHPLTCYAWNIRPINVKYMNTDKMDSEDE